MRESSGAPRDVKFERAEWMKGARAGARRRAMNTKGTGVQPVRCALVSPMRSGNGCAKIFEGIVEESREGDARAEEGHAPERERKESEEQETSNCDWPLSSAQGR